MSPETDTAHGTAKRPSLAEIADLFARYANFTLGGGSATTAVMHGQLVTKRHWLNDERFSLCFALGRLTPGTNLLAFCTATGWLLRGLAGGIVALLARFSELRRKACARTGKSFPIVVIQEAGLDGFWIHRVLLSEGIESHVVDAASIATSRRRRRAKTDRIDGETLLRALLAHKRGEPRVCSMVRAPTPEDEDRRRICRERKVLIMERVQHVNRIKGLLFSQGASAYEPLRRDRRARLEALQTGDGRRLPPHLKAQVCRELDRLNCSRADQGCGGRAGCAAQRGTNHSVGPAADVAGCPWRWAGVRFGPLV